MKKDFQILVIFLSIIAVSGVAIYMIGSSGGGQGVKPVEAESRMKPDQQAQQTPMEFPAESQAQQQMPPQQQGPDPVEMRKTIKLLEDKLKSNPDDFGTLVSLGNAHYDISEPQPAIDYYTRALKLHPNDAGVMVDLGAMYRQTGDTDKAIDFFNNAIKLDPQLPQAYFNLGMVLRMEKNDAKGAAKAWKKYLELDPNSQAKDFLMEQIKAAEGS
jgi:cytochrome c-type biogenesis protein CcmH/NrfG